MRASRRQKRAQGAALTMCACRRGIERIIRKLLALPSRPALVYYHFLPGRFGLFKTHYAVGIEDRIEVRGGCCLHACRCAAQHRATSMHTR